jgi:protein disulfide-isomerase
MFRPLKTLVPVAFLLAAATAPAADGWMTSYDQAVKKSKETGRPILVDFTGSDWCGYCMRLDAQVFSQKEFKTWAAKKVVLLKLDFPRRTAQPASLRRQNEALAEKYQIRGFPTVLLLKPDGNVIGATGYSPVGAAEWVKAVDHVVRKHKAKPKA